MVSWMGGDDGKGVDVLMTESRACTMDNNDDVSRSTERTVAHALVGVMLLKIGEGCLI